MLFSISTLVYRPLSVFIITLYTQFLTTLFPSYHLEEREKNALRLLLACTNLCSSHGSNASPDLYNILNR